MADENLELVRTLLEAQSTHKDEIVQQLRRHEQFMEKRFNWIDRGQLRLDRRMDSLERATNHKVEIITELLEQKADKAELLTSFLFRALNNRLIRWAAGATVVSIIGWIVANHWLVAAAQFIEGLF